jgi:hypothetical protein
MGHTSRSSGLLHKEASKARVSQCGLKTSGGEMAGGVRGTIAEVTCGSSRRQRVDAMGCIGPCYPYFMFSLY